MSETSVPPYAQASVRIDTTPELEPYRDLLLAEIEEDYELHLRWVACARTEDLLIWVEKVQALLRGEGDAGESAHGQ